MDILLWTLVGVLTGFIASFRKNPNDQSLWIDMLLGISGSVTGGFLMTIFGKPGLSGFSLYAIFVSILGSVVLIGTGRRIQEKEV